MSEDAPRQPIDWEAVEQEYRAGQMSLREIGRKHGVNAGTIVKKAKKCEWIQDLSEKVRRETAARLAQATPDGNTDGNSVASREAVKLAAARGVEVVLQHRVLASRAKRIVAGLLGELEAIAEHLPDLEAEIDATCGDGRQAIKAKEAISVASRSKSMRELAGSLETLVRVERQAFSLDAPAQDAARTTIVTVAGASLDGLSVDALDAIESAHAALRSAGVIEPQK